MIWNQRRVWTNSHPSTIGKRQRSQTRMKLLRSHAKRAGGTRQITRLTSSPHTLGLGILRRFQPMQPHHCKVKSWNRDKNWQEKKAAAHALACSSGSGACQVIPLGLQLGFSQWFLNLEGVAPHIFRAAPARRSHHEWPYARVATSQWQMHGRKSEKCSLAKREEKPYLFAEKKFNISRPRHISIGNFMKSLGIYETVRFGPVSHLNSQQNRRMHPGDNLPKTATKMFTSSW